MKYTIILALATIFSIQSKCPQNQQTVGDTTLNEAKEKSYPDDGVMKIEEYIAKNNLQDLPVAYFAGGCFWCTEAVYHRIEGVIDVVSGYAGGGKEVRPTYNLSNQGTTMLVETIAIFYDPDVISYETLLEVFFIAHDPTTLNRQGPDVGTQYRSAIFYQDAEELEKAKAGIMKVDQSEMYSNKVVTTLEAYDQFWTAETYHQNYYELNPNQRYVMGVSRPKVEKTMRTVPHLLKKQYRAK